MEILAGNWDLERTIRPSFSNDLLCGGTEALL